MKAWTHATLLTLLLAWPVIVLGLDEGGKASAAGPLPTAESSAEPEAKDKMVSASGGESAPDSNPPQADGRLGGEVCEESDVLEEELPIIKEGGDGSLPQADVRPGGTTAGKR